MKRVQIIFVSLWAVFSYACTSESIQIPSEPSPLTCEILARGLTNDSHLPDGSTILINATGGLEINNETFTYNGTSWENGNKYNWTDLQEETNITALYPVYTDRNYTSGNIYSEEGLEDILISQHTFQKGASIELQFKHLFSLLTIHLEETIQNECQEIRLSVPFKVDNISPSGSISTIAESHTAILANNGSCDYPFIIPPSSDCTLTLTLVMTDGSSHTHLLNPHTFQSGYEYHCNVIKKERPGIDSAEDLIIFSQLINGTYTREKTLSDFGEQTTDGMVFRLLADIELTETDCQQLSPIGDHEDTPFSYIFDGGNHTISNLILPDEKTEDGYAGLFGHIGSTGVVKNLHMTQATSISNPTCKYVGVITAYNEGLIDNCSVQNSSIYSATKGMIGLICSSSGGKIINCFTQNNTIKVSAETYAGGIAGSADGRISNCYTYYNQFSIPNGSYILGGITGSSTYNTKLTIENCYIYHKQNSTNWGAAVGLPYKVTLDNFFHNKGKAFYDKASDKAKTYDANFCIDDTPITDLLNAWIGENTTFNPWTMSNGTPCFQ